jgi:hypothetical protein
MYRMLKFVSGFSDFFFRFSDWRRYFGSMLSGSKFDNNCMRRGIGVEGRVPPVF